MDIQRGRTKVVKLVPDSPMADPQATIYGLDGLEVSGLTLTATPSAVNTTVAANAANTAQSFSLASASGVAGGLHVLVTDPQFGTAIGIVSAIESTTVRLVDPLPAEPATGATVKGLDVSVTVPAGATAAIGLGYVLEVADAATEDTVRAEFNVVRFPFIGPCKAHHVRAVLARGFPAQFSIDEVFHQLVADEVNLQIRARLLGSARYASAYWNPDTLAPVRAPMVRLVLGEQHGLRESGSARDDYLSSLRLEVQARLGDLLQSLAKPDANMDGAVDADEQRGDIGSVWSR